MSNFNSLIEQLRNEIYQLETNVREKENLLLNNKLTVDDIEKLKNELQLLNDLIDKKEMDLQDIEDDRPIFDLYGKLVID